ncbi:MAG: hypothetical protein WCB94_08820 [Terriglobales bacterium]
MTNPTQKQLRLRGLFDDAVSAGMQLLENALYEIEVDDDDIKRAVAHAKERYKQEGDHLFQHQMDSGWYN